MTELKQMIYEAVYTMLLKYIRRLHDYRLKEELDTENNLVESCY